MRAIAYLILALLAASGMGCFGGTANPSYFPYYLPTGDIIRTHGKPGGIGYFRNFDPKAVKLELTPLNSTNPTRTQQVFIATVRDRDGTPRRKRRVEWILDGPGSIIEVDESGVMPGRGYKVDNRYAVSYTDFFPHTITRGNDDPRDDFEIQPGQTWCVVSSAVEGRTTLTAYAPEVHDWDQGRQFATIDWRDAPFAAGPSLVRSGVEESPRGRDTLADRSSEPGTAAAMVARTPGLTLDVKMPTAVGIGREATATILFSNGNRADSQDLTIRSAVPDGADLVRADPGPTRRVGSTLEWSLEPVAAGTVKTVTLVIRPNRKGTFTVPASAETTDGLRADTLASTTADATSLDVKLEAPRFAAAGERVPVKIVAKNTGAVPIEHAIAWVDVPGSAIIEESRKNPAELAIGRIEPGEVKTVTPALVMEKSGPYPIRVNVTGDGGVASHAEGQLTVHRTEITTTLNGPKSIVLGEEGIFDVLVANPGDVPVRDLRVRASLPRGLQVKSAGDYGKATADGAEWLIPSLSADARTTLRFSVRSSEEIERGTIAIWATGTVGDGGSSPESRASSAIAVQGRPMLTLELLAPTQAVTPGRLVTYRAIVRNRGNGPAHNVEVALETSSELTPRSGAGPRDSQGQPTGKGLSFPVLEVLPPGASAIYVMEAEALKSGDARVAAIVKARDLPRPMREEQPTRIGR